METTALTSSLAELRAGLPELMLFDQRRLGRRAARAAALRGAHARKRALAEVAAEIDAARARVEERRRAVPAISFPPELPVSQRRDEIAAAIRDHQVVVIAGETGSGKTTQLPKICLELGRGVTGQIGHTQPRRIAARTVAERIAAELGTEPGAAIGFKVRFADTSSDGTLVKVMTDGILLTEMQRDRQLLRYDTLIIDEAHERSLNVDFILGYLKRLLPRRPDLKVIITSATIDPERFSKHFGGAESGKRGGGAESNKRGGGGEPGKHFDGAPVIEVSGRTYPVEVRYRPLAIEGAPDVAGGPDDQGEPGDEPRDQVQGILDAVGELCAEGLGDILVFLSGEREIRDTADALTGADAVVGGDLEVLPLYARLSSAEQLRVFQPHRGRRVVLATNVAETSLTVPGIKYVIDPGTARISRYSHRTKVQRLPIEPVSQASANQRKGRCGRTSDGVCIRLYSEEDFASRPEFTDPEILRTNLASVLLRMAALDLGDVADFPFVDPPDSRSVADGVRLLEELGAIWGDRGKGRGERRGGDGGKDRAGRNGTEGGQGGGGHRLTDVGRKLAQLPVDPRLGRMILEADRNGCAREVLIIAAALSIQEPRERPAESREAADAVHARFAEPGSDFLAYLKLWNYLRERQRELSASAFRRMCRREYLHYLRVREWQDLYGQLRQVAKDLGIPVGRADRDTERGGDPEPAAPAGEWGEPIPADLADRVHMSLLAGLLSHMGMKDPNQTSRGKRRPLPEYVGARGARFAIFPDSVLARKPPQPGETRVSPGPDRAKHGFDPAQWVVAAELVETSRLWARTAARIEPEWAEPLAAHLIKRTYGEPHWDAKRGAAMTMEKVTLYGLPIVAARQVTYGRVDPAKARDMFIQHALVEGDWDTHHRFFHHNQRLLDDAGDLERRARRRGIVVGDDAVFEFYDRRIPQSVTSARHFDAWWRKARPADPELLIFSPADLAGPDAGEVRTADYPSTWGDLPLSYEFAPGEPDDGVTVDIPLAMLNQVTGEEFGWQVPGLREELVTELIRSLPKPLRKAFVPVPDAARAALAALGPPRADLRDALAAVLGDRTGVAIPRDAWDLSRLPEHLRITFRITDGDRVLATGKDLGVLRRQLRPRMQAVLTQAALGITRSGLRAWDLGSLPRVAAVGRVRAYPALVDTGDAVDVRLLATETEAAEAMWRGTRRLLLIQVPSGVRTVASGLPAAAKLAMSRSPYPSIATLLDDCAACAADQVIAQAGGPAWDGDGFARLVEAGRATLPAATAQVVHTVGRVLEAAHEAESRLGRVTSPALAPALADIRSQLSALIYPGFVVETGARHLPDLVRYLRAITQRLEKMQENPGRDADRMAVVHRVTDAYQSALQELPPSARHGEEAREVRWMIEQLRVSLFAQTLGTAGPISEKRILAALDRLTARSTG